MAIANVDQLKPGDRVEWKLYGERFKGVVARVFEEHGEPAVEIRPEPVCVDSYTADLWSMRKIEGDG